MARVSLRRRLRLGFALITLMIIAVAAALFQGYRAALAESWQAQADGYLLGLLAELEWTGEQFTLNNPVLDTRMRQPGSGLLAVLRQDGQIFWRSDSALGEPLPENHMPAAPPGQVSRTIESLGRQAYWVSRMLVQWQDTSGQLHPLQLEVWLSQATFERQVRAFMSNLVWGMGAVMLMLALLGRAVSRFALQPMSRLINEDLERVRQGQRERLEGDYPEEVERLVEAFNQVLDQERRRQQQIRHKLDDFAHSLKTPLAVLRGELTREAPDLNVMQQSVQRVDESVQYYLQRASATVQPVFGVQTRIADLVGRLQSVLEKVYLDPPVLFESHVPSHWAVRVSEGDLMEMLGNLMDNACKYGRGRVRISAVRQDDDQVCLTIEDDGRGIPEADRGKVLRRGQRLDESAPGQGIGLAVVSELVHSYGGQVRILSSEALGGARVVIVLPGAPDVKPMV